MDRGTITWRGAPGTMELGSCDIAQMLDDHIDMSSEAAKPTRPVAVMPTLTEALAAAGMPGQQQSLQSSLASLANLRSAFTPMMPQQAPALYPEIALFSQFQSPVPWRCGDGPAAADAAETQRRQTEEAEPRVATPSHPRRMPRDIKRLNRGAEPESMIGEGLCCF